MSSKYFKAAVTVFHVAGKSKLEHELRLDPASNTISDLIEKPTEANGKITLVSKRHRILASSTPGTRDLLASVTKAWQTRISQQNSPRLDPPEQLPSTSSKVRASKSGGVARGSRGARGYLREVTNTDTNRGDTEAVDTGSSETRIQFGDEAKAAAVEKGRAGVVGSSDNKSKRKSNNARRRRGTPPSTSTTSITTTPAPDNTMPRAYAPTNTLNQPHRPPPSTIRKRSGGTSSSSTSSNGRRGTLGSLLGNANGGGSGRRGRQLVQYSAKTHGAPAVTGSAAARSGGRGGDGGGGGQRLGGTTLHSPPLLRCLSGSVGSGIVSRSSGGGDDDSNRKRQKEQGQKRGLLSTLKQQQAGDTGSSEGGDGMPLAASDLRGVTMGDHREKRRRGGNPGDEEEISRISGTGTPPPHSGEVVTSERHSIDLRTKRTGLSGTVSYGRNGMHGGSDRTVRAQYRQSLVRPDPASESRAGFRNMGNTCYINACLQGLLSLGGFVRDLQRKCWVLAMLKPDSVPLPQEDARDGTDPAATTVKKQRRPASASLYDALLRVSLEAARGSHGVMDAAPLKRAMDRHSSRFAGNFQQDAHEFLSDLINALHEETEPRVDVAAAAVAAGSNDNKHKSDDDNSNRKQGLLTEGTAASKKPGTAAPAPLAAVVQGNVKTSMAVDIVPSKAAKQGGGKGEKVTRASEVEFGEKMEAGARAAAAAAAREKGMMPTTRHFHAEVEVTLTCTRCAYSRRRTEPYRDFSLDLPEGPPTGQDVPGLECLLEGFFRPKVLNLKCERCGHDTVCAEHSLAALPGTLVIHIKRFKAVVRPSTPPSSVPTTAVTDLTGMENDSSAATATAASAGAENRESKGASDDGVGVSNGKAEASSWLAGVSYEKTMERVLVPLQLDLTRFCTEFTGNAPSEDLGQRVDSLEAVGITANPSSLSSSFSSGDNVTGDPAGGTHNSKSKSADGGVELKRFSAEISVDLSSREGWKEGENGDRDGRGGGGSASNGNKRIRGSGRDGDVFIGVGVEHEEGGKEAFPAQSPSRLPSANSVGAGVAVGSGRSEGWVDGVGSLASPVPRWGSGGEGASSSGNKGHVNLRKGRSALQVAKDKKEKEKQARTTGSADRWGRQENKAPATTATMSSDKADLRQHPANKNVFVDDKGHIDYFHSISKPSPTNDHLNPRRYGSGGRTAGRGDGGMGGYVKSAIAVGAVARGGMTGGYAKRPGGRLTMLQTDEEEKKQLQAAIAASREDAKNSHSQYLNVDSESELGRALLIGQEDDPSEADAEKRRMTIGASASDSLSGRAGSRRSGEEHGLVDEGEDPVTVKMETAIAAERVGSGRGGVRGTRGPLADEASDLEAAAVTAAAAAREDDELQQALRLSMMDTRSSASTSAIGQGPAQETSSPDYEWACDQCTFLNGPSSSLCEVCGHGKSSAASGDKEQQPQQQQQQQFQEGEDQAARHVQSSSRCTDSSDGATTTFSTRAVEGEGQLLSQGESSRKLAQSVLDGLRVRSRVSSSPRKVVEGDGQLQSQDEMSRKLAQSVLDGLHAHSRVSSSPLRVVEGDRQLHSQDELSRKFAQSVIDELLARSRVASSPLGGVEGDGQLKSRDESSRKFAQSVLNGLRARSVVPRTPLGVVEGDGQSQDLTQQERVQQLAQSFEGYYEWHGQQLKHKRMVDFAQSLLDEMDDFHGVTGPPLEVMGGDLIQRQYRRQKKQEQKKLTDYIQGLTDEMDSVHNAEQSRSVGEERKRRGSRQKRRRAILNENGDDGGRPCDGDGDGGGDGHVHDENADVVDPAVVPMLSFEEETAGNGRGSNNSTKDKGKDEDKDENKDQKEEACKGLLKCLVAALNSSEQTAPLNASAPSSSLSSLEVGGVIAEQNMLASLPPASSPQQQQTQQSAGRGKSEEAAVASSSTVVTHAASTDTASPHRIPRQTPLRARYELRSVLHHLGRHAFAGHYVTDVRDDTGTIRTDKTRQSGEGAVDRGGSGDTGVHGKAQKEGLRVGGVARRECDEVEVMSGGGWKRHNDSFVDSVTEAEALEGDSQRSCYICFYSLAGE